MDESTRTHPAVVVAAVAVTLASAAAIAALAGWLPAVSRSPTAVELLAGAASHAAPAPALVAAPAGPIERRVAKKATPSRASRVEQPEPGIARPAESSPARTEPAAAPLAQAQRIDSWPGVESHMPRRVCSDCGVVEAVREVEKPGEASGVGAVAGGVVGGLIGSQLGGGNGRHAMTVIGAVGGAVAGHQIEKSAKKTAVWEVRVRFDDGSTQTFTHDAPPAWKAGDHVKLSHGVLVADI